MVITSEMKLPTDEELATTEIQLSGAALRAGAFHLGKHCENENNVRRIHTVNLLNLISATEV